MKISTYFVAVLLMFGTISCSSSDGIDEYVDDALDEQANDSQDDSSSDDDGGDDGSNDPDIDDSLSATPADIYFKDLEADAANATLTTNELILKAIESVPEGGIIEFEAKEYTLTATLAIAKSVTLRGVGSLIEGDTTIGAGTIETVININSGKKININTSNVSFESVKIVSANDSTMFSFNGETSDCMFKNVSLHGCSYQLNPNKAMTPGLQCINVSFVDFKFRGFEINRSISDFTLYSKVKKMIFYRCRFDILDPTNSNSRAISIDAGNTEYPNILDFDGMEVRECYFNDCSFASSKCCNFNIIDCTFFIKDVYDYPLHLEEFTRDVVIEGCTFDCDMATVNIIRESDYTVIRNNKATGEAKGFMQGSNCEHLEIVDNDLSEFTSFNASNQDNSSYDINLWGTSGYRYITIRGNQAQTLQYTIAAGSEETMDIDEPAAVTNIKYNVYSYPYEEGEYRIQNVDTGGYLTATTIGKTLISSSSKSLNNSDVWVLTKVWPDRYEIKNKYTGGYLFVEKGGDEDEAGLPTIYDPMTYSFSSSDRKPIWNLTKVNKSHDYGPMIPGGDDSSTITDNGFIKLFSKLKSVGITDERQLWHFEKL